MIEKYRVRTVVKEEVSIYSVEELMEYALNEGVQNEFELDKIIESTDYYVIIMKKAEN